MTPDEKPLRERLEEALTDPDPVGRLEAIVAYERGRELRLTAEMLRQVGRRYHGTPGDRHRRHIANRCAELLVRRNREIGRAASTAAVRRHRAAQTTDTTMGEE